MTVQASMQTNPGPGMRWARRGLVLAGAATIVVGAIVLALDETAPQIVGVAAWLAAAIILHDGVLAPIVFGIDLLLRRSGRRIGLRYLAVVQVAVVTGAVLTLVVAPEIRAATIGNPNPTVVPFDYAARLAWVWAGLAIATVLACLLVRLAGGRRALTR